MTDSETYRRLFEEIAVCPALPVDEVNRRFAEQYPDAVLVISPSVELDLEDRA